MDQTQETNSLEVRWFGTGHVPQSVDEWITRLGSVDTATRTDLYLSPLTPSLNLKLRGSGGDYVEVKRLLGGPERHAFGPDATGDVEQWYKWSFSLDHSPGLWTEDPTGLWLPVEKTRTLYAFDRAEIASLDDALSDTTVSAHVEVTEVTVRSWRAWTCGLEVAGAAEELEAVFAVVGAASFGDGFPIELSADQSVGYARWLGELATDSSPDSAVLVPSNR